MSSKKVIATTEPLTGDALHNLALSTTRTLRSGKTVYIYEPTLEDLNSFGEIESQRPPPGKSMLDLILQNKSPIRAATAEVPESVNIDELSNDDIESLFNNLNLQGGRRRKYKKARTSRRRSSRKSKKSRKSKSSRK